VNDVATTRALVLGLTLGALLSGGACVGRGDCTAANCGGCCDEAGECRTGNTASACGLGGAACISCGESVCKADGTCFVSAQVRPVPVDDAGLPFTEDGGFVEADAGARVDGGAPPDAGLNDGGPGDAGEVSDAGSVDAGTFLPRDQCTMPIEVGVPDAGNFTDAPVLTFSGGRLLLGYAEYLAGGGGRSLCQTRLFEDGGWGPVVTHGAGSQARRDPRGLTLSPAGNQ
jgi:hypothetical protein